MMLYSQRSELQGSELSFLHPELTIYPATDRHANLQRQPVAGSNTTTFEG